MNWSVEEKDTFWWPLKPAAYDYTVINVVLCECPVREPMYSGPASKLNLLTHDPSFT